MNFWWAGGRSEYAALLVRIDKRLSRRYQFNLERLVADYNASVAGTLTPAGRAGVSANQRYPTITLPADYQLGDTFSSQDIRLTKTIPLGRASVQLIGEVFNVLNISNLTNFNYNLVVPATFGRANQRVGQTFGSGGPRALQVAGRVSF